MVYGLVARRPRSNCRRGGRGAGGGGGLLLLAPDRPRSRGRRRDGGALPAARLCRRGGGRLGRGDAPARAYRALQHVLGQPGLAGRRTPARYADVWRGLVDRLVIAD